MAGTLITADLRDVPVPERLLRQFNDTCVFTRVLALHHHGVLSEKIRREIAKDIDCV